jgi:hypothetical protein
MNRTFLTRLNIGKKKTFLLFNSIRFYSNTHTYKSLSEGGVRIDIIIIMYGW